MKNSAHHADSVRARFDGEVEFWHARYTAPTRNFLNYELKRRRDIFTQFLEEFRSRPLKMLDIGCGTGNLLQSLVSWSPQWRGFGIDISPGMVAFCQKQYPGMLFAEANVEYDDFFTDTSFDVIICSGVLGYLHRPAGFLNKVAGRLRDDGWLLLSFGNSGSPFRQLRHWLDRPFKFVSRWIPAVSAKRFRSSLYRTYRIEEIKALVSTHFEIVETEYISFSTGLFGRFSVRQEVLLERIIGTSQFKKLARTVLVKCRRIPGPQSLPDASQAPPE